jgi:uncharacterized protein (UPF0332 family)
MKGAAFIRVAEKLAPSRDEAERRTAISRAYYAAFHAARDFFEDLDFRVPRADAAHAYLSRRLPAASSAPQLVAAGNDLSTLRSYRNEADYDVHRTVNSATSQLAVNLAHQILTQLAATRTPAEQSVLIAEIEAYETSVLRESTRRA